MLFTRHKLIDAPTTVRPTTRISRIPTTRFPTTRISRIPTTRFPTTPKPTCQEDGQKYPVGHVISRNNYCERCTCGYDGRNRDPDWMCMVTDCFGYPHSDYPFGIFTLLLHKAEEGCIRMRNASCALNLLLKIRLKLSRYQKKDHCKMVQ